MTKKRLLEVLNKSDIPDDAVLWLRAGGIFFVGHTDDKGYTAVFELLEIDQPNSPAIVYRYKKGLAYDL